MLHSFALSDELLKNKESSELLKWPLSLNTEIRGLVTLCGVKPGQSPTVLVGDEQAAIMYMVYQLNCT